MLEPRHLKNAPITEAVLDIRVKPRSGFDISAFEQIPTPFNDLQTKKPILYNNININVAAEKPTTRVESELLGFQFWSKDERDVAFFRRDGFSFSRLHPYTDWQQVFARMKPLAMEYLKMAQPDQIIRLAVRYINKFNLPTNITLNEYLVSSPTVPEGLPQTLGNFLSHIVIQDLKDGIAASVTQALQPPETKGELVILLDIDAFKEVSLEVDDQVVWSIFEQLRGFKNKIFFANVTQKTIDLLEK